MAVGCGGDVEGYDAGGFVCCVAVFDDEELVLGVEFPVAGLDPVAVGFVGVEDVHLARGGSCAGEGGEEGEG